jgi:hypothetical protein
VTEEFRDRYRSAFEQYLAARAEGDLQAAYELGRDAVAGELSVLDLAAIHHEALLEALRGTPADRIEAILDEGRDFFVESLSAFEIVRRAYGEAREAAVVERNQAAILRRLSSFLADASLAMGSADSVEEALQLVAEQAREVAGASCCIVGVADRGWEAISCASSGDAWDELGGAGLARVYTALSPPAVLRLTAAEVGRDPVCRALPRVAWLAAPLTGLDGRELGLIHLLDKDGRDFSDVDEAVLVQLAQMTSAAIERASLYDTSTSS